MLVTLLVMPTARSGKIYVALVDDDESLCRSLARLLRAAGIQAITYLSAEAFLSDTKQPQFDCLILDVQLLGMSGLQLQKQLKSSGIAAPIIFITAYDDPQAREQARSQGCVGFFRKTDSGSEVLEAVRRAVAEPSAHA